MYVVCLCVCVLLYLCVCGCVSVIVFSFMQLYLCPLLMFCHFLQALVNFAHSSSVTSLAYWPEVTKEEVEEAIMCMPDVFCQEFDRVRFITFINNL